MNNIIIEKIEDEIKTLLDELSNLDSCSDEYAQMVHTINNLYGTLHKEKELELNLKRCDIESSKVENDYVIRDRQLDIESEKDQNNLLNNREQRLFQQNENLSDRCLQVDTLKDSKVWNVTKTVVEVGSVVAPLVFYGVWMKRGLKFEEEGSFTSQTFKGLIGKFKPTK